MTMDDRRRREIAHGKFLAADPLKWWGHAGWAGQYRVDRRVRLFAEKAGLRAGDEVVELGAGTGEFTKRLALSGARITAIEISPDLVKLAEDRLKGVPGVELIQGDAESLESLGDRTFDAVVGNSILHHLDAGKALASAFRVLKPGGHVAFSEPNMLNPQIAMQKNIPWLKKALGDSPDETAFFVWQMRRLLREAGFVDVHVRPFDFLHPSLPDALAKRLVGPLAFLEHVPFVRAIAGSLLIWARKP